MKVFEFHNGVVTSQSRGRYLGTLCGSCMTHITNFYRRQPPATFTLTPQVLPSFQDTCANNRDRSKLLFFKLVCSKLRQSLVQNFERKRTRGGCSEAVVTITMEMSVETAFDETELNEVEG